MFILYIPIILAPYLALFAVCLIFLANKSPFMNYLMTTVFDDNALYLTGALFLYCMLVGGLGILCYILSIKKKWDALAIARTAMIVKLVQTPASLCILALGTVLLITIFTFPIAFALFLIEAQTMVMTGLLVRSSVMAARRDQTIHSDEFSWAITLQRVICANVVASIIYYAKLKKATAHQLPDREATFPTDSMPS